MGRYRLALKQVDLATQPDGNLEARVELISQGKFFVGVSKGKLEGDARLRLPVEATLMAISESITKPIKFILVSVDMKELDARGKKFVVVLLKTDYFIPPVGEAIELLGSCQVAGSDAEACVRATLNATNRTISLLLR